MPHSDHNTVIIESGGIGGKDTLQTPKLLSPPETKTPPTLPTKRHHDPAAMSERKRESEPVDPNALSKALEQFENASRPRDHTPGASPSRKRQRVYGDRFIPNRSGQDLQANFSLLNDDGSPSTPRSQRRQPNHELHFQKTEEANRTYATILRAEMFDNSIPKNDSSSRAHTPPNQASALPTSNLTPSTPHKNLFSYLSPARNSFGQFTPSRTPHKHGPNINPNSEIYSLSPVKQSSQKMLLTPRRQPRAVSKVPYKVLDAPDLADDFYLNLVDWGNTNILGVGLGSCVYMWNSQSGKVTKLCELNDDSVTSVNWIQRGSHLAIGTSRGFVQIWDANSQRRLRTMTGHTGRVGALAWNSHILTSGSRDRSILHRDVRSPDQYLTKLTGHKQEVCGLKWNSEDNQLASGGNDNKLMVWENLHTEPLYRWSEHSAAVKAIAWSPHQRGLLASGGGTADRTIKFWNTQISAQGASNAAAAAAMSIGTTITGTDTATAHEDFNFGAAAPVSPPVAPPPANLINSYDTGSQVCNLAWSRNSNEIVSTHGYSQNQIIVWKYPSMSQVVSLTGHTYRVLYLAMSPDGSVIVTGAGDETLRFWNAFRKRERSGFGVGGSGLGVEGWGTIR
ncbi:WD40 repeat-like protein [Eremomyces bilateralis CBS 781.70]|uniref:WD40 repeat-like protein n=1 Tax=Eremomyces bilateralis CBS 781.70 TaxID=1392243 RepID=A0A6G1GBI4_9PEZI|nr:WD40 repeat-like protein [Eremomyces bilateralis CBS 781.70]KAF1815458.1 WD40 repeat-like protein [Eremomyces bilateralis CBS 781.70]